MGRFGPGLGLLLLAGCGEAPRAAAAGEAEAAAEQAKSAEEAVRAANAAKDEAMIAQDAAALGRFYTDDYRVIDDRAGIHDRSSQIKFMTEEVALLRATSDEVQVSMIAPDAALVTGRLTGRYRMDGKETDFVERYTGLWVREGEAWRVKHEHGSLEPAGK